MAKAPEKKPFAGKGDHDDNGQTGGAKPDPSQNEADEIRTEAVATEAETAEKPKAKAPKGKEPAVTEPSPTQAELDAMRDGRYRRDVSAANDSADYKTR